MFVFLLLQDSNEQEYFYNGSIGKLEMGEVVPEHVYSRINNQIAMRCKREIPYKYMSLGHARWAGMDRHATQVDCEARGNRHGF